MIVGVGLRVERVCLLILLLMVLRFLVKLRCETWHMETYPGKGILEAG